MIEEYKVNLTKYQEEFIEWVVNGVDFPLYSVFSDNINPIFNHTLRNKAIDNDNYELAQKKEADILKQMKKFNKFVTKGRYQSLPSGEILQNLLGEE